MAQSDPETMAGAPVFRGTRIPVCLVADMIEQGTPIDEILEGYPALTREMVEYAVHLRDYPSSTWPAADAAMVWE